MPASTINVRIPQVTSIEMAIRLYYERTELSNPEIKALFGTGNNTVCKLKRKARELMIERGTPVWNAQRVNTEVAYEAWGLNITDLEHRLKKLKSMGVNT